MEPTVHHAKVMISKSSGDERLPMQKVGEKVSEAHSFKVGSDSYTLVLTNSKITPEKKSKLLIDAEKTTQASQGVFNTKEAGKVLVTFSSSTLGFHDIPKSIQKVFADFLRSSIKDPINKTHQQDIKYLHQQEQAPTLKERDPELKVLNNRFQEIKNNPNLSPEAKKTQFEQLRQETQLRLNQKETPVQEQQNIPTSSSMPRKDLVNNLENVKKETIPETAQANIKNLWEAIDQLNLAGKNEVDIEQLKSELNEYIKKRQPDSGIPLKEFVSREFGPTREDCIMSLIQSEPETTGESITQSNPTAASSGTGTQGLDPDSFNQLSKLLTDIKPGDKITLKDGAIHIEKRTLMSRSFGDSGKSEESKSAVEKLIGLISQSSPEQLGKLDFGRMGSNVFIKNVLNNRPELKSEFSSIRNQQGSDVLKELNKLMDHENNIENFDVIKTRVDVLESLANERLKSIGSKGFFNPQHAQEVVLLGKIIDTAKGIKRPKGSLRSHPNFTGLQSQLEKIIGKNSDKVITAASFHSLNTIVSKCRPVNSAITDMYQLMSEIELPKDFTYTFTSQVGESVENGPKEFKDALAFQLDIFRENKGITTYDQKTDKIQNGKEPSDEELRDLDNYLSSSSARVLTESAQMGISSAFDYLSKAHSAIEKILDSAVKQDGSYDKLRVTSNELKSQVEQLYMDIIKAKKADSNIREPYDLMMAGKVDLKPIIDGFNAFFTDFLKYQNQAKSS